MTGPAELGVPGHRGAGPEATSAVRSAGTKARAGVPRLLDCGAA